MSYVNKMVSVYGNEKEFIKSFVNELTSADSRITCETDIDAEFANEDPFYTPTIVFNVGNICKISLIRDRGIDYSTSIYSFTLTIKENTYVLSSLCFSSYAYYINELATRSWRLKLISNDNAIQMFFGNYDNGANIYINNIGVVIDTINCVGYSKEANTLASNFITLEETSKTLVISNRIPYIIPYIDNERPEIITNKVFVNSASEKVLNTQAFYDCSTVVKDSVVNVDNQRCYVIDEHTLMPIKE